MTPSALRMASTPSPSRLLLRRPAGFDHLDTRARGRRRDAARTSPRGAEPAGRCNRSQLQSRAIRPDRGLQAPVSKPPLARRAMPRHGPRAPSRVPSCRPGWASPEARGRGARDAALTRPTAHSPPRTSSRTTQPSALAASTWTKASRARESAGRGLYRWMSPSGIPCRRSFSSATSMGTAS